MLKRRVKNNNKQKLFVTCYLEIIRKIQQSIKVSVSSIQQHNREVVNSNFTINQTLT